MFTPEMPVSHLSGPRLFVFSANCQFSDKNEEMTYGQSVTDACIGWEDSVECLAQLASANRARMR